MRFKSLLPTLLAGLHVLASVPLAQGQIAEPPGRDNRSVDLALDAAANAADVFAGGFPIIGVTRYREIPLESDPGQRMGHEMPSSEVFARGLYRLLEASR